jgi:hypothetical protein
MGSGNLDLWLLLHARIQTAVNIGFTLGHYQRLSTMILHIAKRRTGISAGKLEKKVSLPLMG